MDAETRGWLAGLLEGEGWFGIYRVGARSGPEISVNMIDRDIIERVAELFGTKPYGPRIYKTRPEAQPYYRARLRGKRAAELMKQLYPMLGERRRQRIDEILR